MAGGRPTSYRKQYCKQIRDHLGKGFTKTSFVAKEPKTQRKKPIGRELQKQWRKKHAEFSDATKDGEIMGEKSLLELGYGLAMGAYPKGNGAVWIFMMKNMVGWRDKQDIDIGTKKDITLKLAYGLPKKAS